MVALLQITLTLLGSAPVMLRMSECKTGSRVTEDLGCRRETQTSARVSQSEVLYRRSHTFAAEVQLGIS